MTCLYCQICVQNSLHGSSLKVNLKNKTGLCKCTLYNTHNC